MYTLLYINELALSTDKITTPYVCVSVSVGISRGIVLRLVFPKHHMVNGVLMNCEIIWIWIATVVEEGYLLYPNTPSTRHN